VSYLDKIDEYKDEMIETLKELISIKSVVEKPVGDFPFGEGVDKAFKYFLKMGQSAGFKTQNVDNYGGHLEFSGEEDSEIIAILGHLDVVPEGSEWDFPPYGGEIKDGRLYGRGAIDNKGPMVAAFYALKALKDSNIETEKRVRIIIGLDEEVNWSGMKYYLDRSEKPSFGFTPDADFPVINGEKGILIFELVKKIDKSLKPGIKLISLKGGNAPNMVPDSCQATLYTTDVSSVKNKLALYREKTGNMIEIRVFEKNFKLIAQGISAHGAHPELGKNAISIMMEFLNELQISNEDISEFIEFYNDKIGFDLNGGKMSLDLSDDESGKLIFNVGQAAIDKDTARIIVNIRYPISCTDEDVYKILTSEIERFDLGVMKIDHKEPIYMEKDSEIVTTLMDIYRKHSGDMNSQPIVIGGGTYARAMENAVAFGAIFPGEAEVAHQKNEYIDINSLIKATKIYAEAIYTLAKGRPMC
jgi:succinyl-diaminopimelate desuccinylase